MEKQITITDKEFNAITSRVAREWSEETLNKNGYGNMMFAAAIAKIHADIVVRLQNELFKNANPRVMPKAAPKANPEAESVAPDGTEKPDVTPTDLRKMIDKINDGSVEIFIIRKK
ncbi:MAG: hypothetical protein DBY32_03940 [Phascolarctobacterium sp.]|nr:MAG: hypothetical protein DBY32_03940 [Phascolarctobacterium sp.]